MTVVNLFYTRSDVMPVPCLSGSHVPEYLPIGKSHAVFEESTADTGQWIAWVAYK